jgi:ubiquinone/menaquinone biosynthesis C-methylase UbiE
MIELAKENCPNVDFKIGSMNKLPFKNSSFDIVTASLSIHYVNNINTVFKEIYRILKKGGLFYYSNESTIVSAREKYENNDIKIVGIGKFIDKKSGKIITLGKSRDE